MTASESLLSPMLVREAEEAAGRLADELAIPPPADPGWDRSPASPRWRGQSLSKGAAGVAVLHALRARSGTGSWERVRAWLADATREELSIAPGSGLWFGAVAVAFAAAITGPTKDHAVLGALDKAAAMVTRSRLDAAAVRIAARVRPARAEFDLVRGLTGLGAYFLLRHRCNDVAYRLLREVLSYLVALTEPLAVPDAAGRRAPGWWSTDLPGEAAFTGGFSDHGMAHGIAGPLALLSTATRSGIELPGQADAIGRICEWLDTWCQDAPEGAWWPEFITLDDLRNGHPSQSAPARPSWCYGTPGLARAQQIAGLAIGDPYRRRIAEEALSRCLASPGQLARLTDPAACHGLGGVLATAWRAAADAAIQTIAEHVPDLLSALLREQARADTPARPRPGLIEGTAGIAATLHTIATGTAHGWDMCLLISGGPSC